MKNIVIFLLILFGGMNSFAQNYSGLQSSQKPHTLFEVNSANKGFLLPTINDTNAINSPSNGLLIFRQNNKPVFYQQNSWKEFLNFSLDELIGNNGSNMGHILQLRNTSNTDTTLDLLRLNLYNERNLSDYIVNNSIRLGQNQQNAGIISNTHATILPASSFKIGFDNLPLMGIEYNSEFPFVSKIVFQEREGFYNNYDKQTVLMANGLTYTDRPANAPAIQDGYVLTSDNVGNATWLPFSSSILPSFSQVDTINIFIDNNTRLNNLYKESLNIEEINPELQYEKFERLVENGLLINDGTLNSIKFQKNRYNIQFGLEFGNPSTLVARNYEGPFILQFIPLTGNGTIDFASGQALEYSQFVKMDINGTKFISPFIEFLPKNNVPYKIFLTIPPFGNTNTDGLNLSKISLKILNIN